MPFDGQSPSGKLYSRHGTRAADPWRPHNRPPHRPPVHSRPASPLDHRARVLAEACGFSSVHRGTFFPYVFTGFGQDEDPRTSVSPRTSVDRYHLLMLDLGGTPDSELFPAIELTALTCCPRCRPGNPADDPRVGQTDGVDIATLIAAGWSSGVNAYLTVLLLGSAGRLGLADTPESLQRNWVLGAAAVLYLIEFVVDKVPLLDSAWDAVHTFIRPAIGAALGVALVDGQTDQLVAALLAGGLALTGHAAKSTTRLAINTSPEPVTNVIASLGRTSPRFQ